MTALPYRNIKRLFRLFSFLLIFPFLFGCTSEASRPDSDFYTRKNETTQEAKEVGSATPKKKRVAITFDDGPQYANEGSNTVALVDELNKYGFHATFFVVGNRIGNGSALSYAVEHGNEIGIHGFTHASDRYYDVCSDEVYEQEVEKTRAAIESAVEGYDVRLMRPVGGRIDPARASASPYSIIMWSVDSADWQHRYGKNDTDEQCAETVNAIVENVMSTVSDGDIILMHDIYQSTYDAAVIILQRLYEEGYDVVTVSELFDNELVPGQTYEYAQPIGA